MTAASREVGRSPDQRRPTLARAKSEARLEKRKELRLRIAAVRFEIEKLAALTRSGAKSDRTPLEVLAMSARLFEDLAVHLGAP